VVDASMRPRLFAAENVERILMALDKAALLQ